MKEFGVFFSCDKLLEGPKRKFFLFLLYCNFWLTNSREHKFSSTYLYRIYSKNFLGSNAHQRVYLYQKSLN